MNNAIETTLGPVRGREREATLLFAGIPYAAAPTGSLRFCPPQAPEPWTTVRDARRFGRAAPQRPTAGLTSNRPIPWSEDCLTLNVSTPACDGGHRAVLAWVHGGDFRTGLSGIPWYDGTRFARRGDVVVVSLNYRLGALGFASMRRFGADYAESGNLGLLDQIAALTWVKRNIERFGGDPGRVTIAGESAGAFSVASLLAAPRAADLFHAAILQSGAGHHCLPPEIAEAVSDRFCEILGIEKAEDLPLLDADRVLDAQEQIDAELYPRGTNQPLGVSVAPFYPVRDGITLAENPIDAIAAGASSDLPVLLGTNADETTLWLEGEFSPGRLDAVARHFGNPELAEGYREAMPGASDRDLQVAMSTDHGFRIPALRLAEARDASHGAPTWVYRFSWKSRAFGGHLGATHALEIPFVFDNLDRAGVDVFLGEGPLPQALASRMHAAWTAFIQKHDPGCEDVGTWPDYRRNRRASMEFGSDVGVVLDPDAGLRNLWDRIR